MTRDTPNRPADASGRPQSGDPHAVAGRPAAAGLNTVVPKGVDASAPGWATVRRGLHWTYKGTLMLLGATLWLLSAALAFGMLLAFTLAAEHPLLCLLLTALPAFGLLLANFYARNDRDDDVVRQFLKATLPPLVVCGVMLFVVFLPEFAGLVTRETSELYLGMATVVVGGALVLGTVLIALQAALAGLVMMAGWLQCLAVPRESKARLWISGAALNLAACLAGYVAAVVVLAALHVPALRTPQDLNRTLQDLNEPGFQMAALFAGALLWAGAMAAHVMFVLFLRGVARFFEDEPTRRFIGSYLLYFGFVATAGLVTDVLWMLGAIHPAAGIVLKLPLAMLSLVQLVWFVRVLSATRDVIRLAE